LFTRLISESGWAAAGGEQHHKTEYRQESMLGGLRAC